MEEIDKLPFILTKELEHDIKKSLTKYMHTKIYLALSNIFVNKSGTDFRMLKRGLSNNDQSI